MPKKTSKNKAPTPVDFDLPDILNVHFNDKVKESIKGTCVILHMGTFKSDTGDDAKIGILAICNDEMDIALHIGQNADDLRQFAAVACAIANDLDNKKGVQ